MKELFLALVSCFSQHGDIREAIMYSGCDFSTVTATYKGETFKITISKEKTDGNDND